MSLRSSGLRLLCAERSNDNHYTEAILKWSRKRGNHRYKRLGCVFRYCRLPCFLRRLRYIWGPAAHPRKEFKYDILPYSASPRSSLQSASLPKLPKSGGDADKQRFAPKRILSMEATARCAPLLSQARLNGSLRANRRKRRSQGRLPSICRVNMHCRAFPTGRSSRTGTWIALGTSFDDKAMREYLTFASPAEFRSRNIFTEERPLRRGRARA
jgi:hypothetical protein